MEAVGCVNEVDATRDPIRKRHMPRDIIGCESGLHSAPKFLPYAFGCGEKSRESINTTPPTFNHITEVFCSPSPIMQAPVVVLSRPSARSLLSCSLFLANTAL